MGYEDELPRRTKEDLRVGSGTGARGTEKTCADGYCREAQLNFVGLIEGIAENIIDYSFDYFIEP